MAIRSERLRPCQCARSGTTSRTVLISEWSASRLGCITPGETFPGSWVGTRAGLDDIKKLQFLTVQRQELRPPLPPGLTLCCRYTSHPRNCNSPQPLCRVVSYRFTHSSVEYTVSIFREPVHPKHRYLCTKLHDAVSRGMSHTHGAVSSSEYTVSRDQTISEQQFGQNEEGRGPHLI
jgi:hypothetical protein